MKIMTIVGARPQFIKAAPVSRALRKIADEFLLHTGQHYDANMSQLFFDELQIPAPDLNLEIGSGPHGLQTGQMLVAIEKALMAQQPDWVLVYGDTNSTLAGAVAAAKLNIPIAHVEAGLRSYNRLMPEEINRILTDRISALLFCPTSCAVTHLAEEGIRSGVHWTGDVMYDAALYFAALAQTKSAVLQKLNLQPHSYVLATVHRAQNTDDPAALSRIMGALLESGQTIVFPVHPRTAGFLRQYGLLEKMAACSRIRLLAPVGYLDMICLEKNARRIVTDSGGVQKEAYFFQTPCITLREETEWSETVEDGWNVLTGTDPEKIVQAVSSFHPTRPQGRHYGDGRAADRIAELLSKIGH
ncbi:MAG TPA: UDP-N-acetylglucosamine 2-epimerase (non-hydrolyzing) [bacterium]|nr:UDP-N-acetylglucosamine 2-epimerase (non-hydrolyzing) [bacterium]HPN34613.1 UDP-N-acetylglucosamine 2-epimerase (non-hydrolyzing) [bacterium]